MTNIIQEDYNKLESELNAGLSCGYYLGYANSIMSLRMRKFREDIKI